MVKRKKKIKVEDLTDEDKLRLVDVALIKKAVGYTSREVVEEFGEEDGELILKKKKVTSKNVPPDVTAIKMYLDRIGTPDDLKSLTDEELQQEKCRLLKLLEETKNNE